MMCVLLQQLLLLLLWQATRYRLRLLLLLLLLLHAVSSCLQLLKHSRIQPMYLCHQQRCLHECGLLQHRQHSCCC
jgi:hypothetical protein